MVESKGQNEANSTMEPEFDAIGDEGEPETLYNLHGGITFDPVDSCSHVTPFASQFTFDPEQKCFLGR